MSVGPYMASLTCSALVIDHSARRVVVVGCVGDKDKEGLDVSLLKPHPDFSHLKANLPTQVV